MKKFTLGERAVYGVQRCSKELSESVWSRNFYWYLLDVLENDTWREYITEAFGRPCRFDDLRAFLTHKDGLCWPSVPEVLQMIQIVADCQKELPPEKNALPGPKLQQWAQNALAALKDAGVELLQEKAAVSLPLAEHGTNQHGEQEREDMIISTPPVGGTSQTYLLRRLARDRPDLLERVKTGEFKSARAAAIEAGIVKPVPILRLVDDHARVAAKMIELLGHEKATELATTVLSQAEGRSA